MGNLIKYAPGGNIGVNPVPALMKKYLTDYANRGYMYAYPLSIGSFITKYLFSPYNKVGNAPHGSVDKDGARRALFAKTFGLTEGLNFNPDDYIEESPYKPTNAKNPDAKYYRVKPSVYANNTDQHYGFRFGGDPGFQDVAGEYKHDKGVDSDGRRYVSLYDIWDLAPFSNKKNDFGKLTKPIELYDRVYEDERPDVYYYYAPEDNPRNLKKGGLVKSLM